MKRQNPKEGKGTYDDKVDDTDHRVMLFVSQVD
jgi:hypothetical protein